ncbi:MAG TPA: hypothetical protein VKE96_32545 [Vicinamibacterales bacterium]|nr:hypothetical protein [Vicinamibacterales bacterium]
MLHSSPRTSRLIVGGLAGACAWPLVGIAAPWLPEPLRFLAGWFLFTIGPGFVVTAALGREFDGLTRVILMLAAGTAAAPVLIDLLGRAHLLALFPYAASALAGACAAFGVHDPRDTRRADRADAIVGAALVALAAALGAIVFWHRLSITGDGISVFGDYDSADISWYAAVASEASHTVPPTASYYSGHQLNAAYYAHLMAAMVHRFWAVPVLSIFFRYAWPTYVSLTAATAFVLVRLLASRGVAALAVVFLLIGSDFSYLAAWFLPHAAVDWDYLLWPTNFLSPTMQVMHFSTWSPSLPVYFAALFAIVRAVQTRAWGWVALAGFLIGILFEFKPFAWVVLMGGLGASMIFAGGDWPARRRFAATIVAGLGCSLPFIWGAATLDPADRRTQLVIDFFMLPKRMLIKIDLTNEFLREARRLAPVPSLRTPIFVLLATIVFLVVGIGVRWLGVPAMWRAIRAQGGGDAAAWRLLAWTVVSGIAVPFVLTTNPYVDTLQFYLAGLYVMWIFAAYALVIFAQRHPAAGAIAIAGALVAAFPSSGHYLAWKWTERTRAPRVSLSGPEVAVAERLRAFDPETTVVLHDRPLSPSLTAIVAARRIVLGWDVRYSAVGGEERLRDVNRFYDSAAGDPAVALDMLRKYRVTHVIVRPQADRVHPDVLAELKPILEQPGVVLYEVPRLQTDRTEGPDRKDGTDGADGAERTVGRN